MTKIFIELKDNKLNFSIRKRLNTEQKSLINTNVISQNELIFSDEYLMQNKKIVASFLKELCSSTNISTITIREYDIALLILDIVKYIPSIQAVYFLQDTAITYKLCEAILKSHYIKYISVYSLQPFMLEMLDKEKIIVDSRNEILFTSRFMVENKLDKFSSLYYKITINLTFPLSNQDEEDLYSFCNINKYLKTIHVNTVNKSDIEYLLNILNKNKFKNIKIVIEDNIKDGEAIEYLKKMNKANNNNIRFKINYSKDYLEENIMNQLQINTIKVCIFIVLVIISIIVLYVFGSNYNSMQKVETIQNDISTLLDLEEALELPEVKEEEVNDLEVQNEELAKLLTLNEDTVGWLKVNNTNVDYPVVQANDNDYYLDKNFYKQKDSSGWLFMDYRNDPKYLSQNTIIFGHNMYYSGVMFGTLYKTKYSNWYTKEENQLITFNTLYENIEWKIFSIYVTPVTNDYLIANFSTSEKFQSFLDMLTARSIYDFGIPVFSSDKILTLSTCANNGTNRLVIHAVRMN